MPDTAYQTDDLLIFLHIPKTGGTTLRWSIEDQFSPSEIVRCYKALGCNIKRDIEPRPDAWKRRIRFVASHHPFGSHQYFPQNATYMTMLREPDSRAISAYYHNVHHGRASHSLDHFVRNMMTLKRDNYQVRLLSDRRYAETVSEADLARALTNLRESFSSVGLMERFNQSLALFASIYGWRSVSVVRRNNRKIRWSMDELSAEQRDLLHQHNALDHVLYQAAESMFEELMARCLITPEVTARTVRDDALARVGLYARRVRMFIHQRRLGKTLIRTSQQR